AGTVIITDLSDKKLEIARQFGVDVTVNPKERDLARVLLETTEGRGPDRVIVAAGVPALFTQAVELVARGGTVLGFAANAAKDVATVQVGRLFWDEITIAGSYSSTPFDYPEALDLLHRGQVDAHKMITHRMTLDQLGEAIEMGHRAQDNLKIMIEMSPGAGAEVGHSPSARASAKEDFS
ncbi:MAG: zinc-binding dehydrogenase, partial [Firmicutes bacterium]|nr:zinc-binding dehydrogenase [Bacillota bacterium]